MPNLHLKHQNSYLLLKRVVPLAVIPVYVINTMLSADFCHSPAQFYQCSSLYGTGLISDIK